MKKYIVENGVYANFTQMQKNAVKTEALMSGNAYYKGIKAVCIVTADNFDIESVYATAKEKYVAWNKGQYKMYDKYIEVTEPAKVQPEVKAAEVKEKVEEETMSDNMVVMTTKEFNAILEAARTSVSVKEVVKTVYPADYETLKKTAATWQSKCTEATKEAAEYKEKYEKLVASMKEAKPVEKDTLVKAINEPMTEEEKEAWNIPEKKDDTPFNEQFCEANKAFKEEVKKEEKREDCLFGDDFVFSTDYITQIRTLQNILGYTGALLNKTKLACEWNRDKKVSFTNGYEFVAAITKLAIPSDMWKEVVTGLTTEREGTNIVSKNVRAQLKAYYEEGLSKKEIGEVMSMVE